MRTYDPADRILYVHLAQDRATPASPLPARDGCDRLPAGYANVSLRATPASPLPARDGCDRLPAGYANVSLRARLGEPRTAGARPALVLLPGGSAAADGPAPTGPALRLAQ